MKKLIALSMLSAFWGLATAQTGPGMGAVTISGAHQGIQLPAKSYRILPEDLLDFRGTYVLSNGQLLHVTSMGPRLYAEVAGAAPAQLLAATPNTFVALDRQMALTFSPATGAVTGVTLRIVDSRQALGGERGEWLALVAHR